MQYTCEICNYSTKYCSSLSNHKKTKSHIRKSEEIQNKHISDECQKGTKPQSKTESNDKSDDEDIELLKQKCEFLQKQNAELLSDVKYLRSDVKYLQSLVNQTYDIMGDAMETAKLATNILDHVAHGLGNTPVIDANRLLTDC